MAIDMRVVTPEDLGATIVMDLKESGKYDVDISKLDLPAGVESLALEGTTLKVTTNKGEKTVDLSPLLPQIVSDVFLKNAERQANEIVFTVGVQDGSKPDTTFRINIADLLPVVSDGQTITGTGVTADPLKVTVAAGNNLLTATPTGLAVTEESVTQVVQAHLPTHTAGIRLVNASGQTVIGYIHETENG